VRGSKFGGGELWESVYMVCRKEGAANEVVLGRGFKRRPRRRRGLEGLWSEAQKDWAIMNLQLKPSIGATIVLVDVRRNEGGK